jgi:type II secretory pathway pseudopilin PulG
MRKNFIASIALIAALTALVTDGPVVAALAAAQATATMNTPYQPKFKGDPARSESEAAALAYMRVVLRAQRQFNKQYGHFATTLAELVHSGSFTKRMVNPERGDYTVSFHGKKDSFVLSMMPTQLDAAHRSFYAEDDYKIHADEENPADTNSPVVK